MRIRGYYEQSYHEYSFTYKFLCGHTLSPLSYAFPEVELLHQMVTLCSTFQRAVNCFPEWLHYFTLPSAIHMATHSSILAWKIPWTEDPGRLQSMGSQRVGHDWATSLHFSKTRGFQFFHSHQCLSLSVLKHVFSILTISLVPLLPIKIIWYLLISFPRKHLCCQTTLWNNF